MSSSNRLGEKHTLSTAFLPLLTGVSVFGAGRIEDHIDSDVRKETVRSTIVISAPPDVVWQSITAFDDVRGSIPFLMQLGLPVPQSCTMQGTGVGSERVCHFNSGFIREQVTQWDPPYHLEFDVKEVQLPGRHWLGFHDAAYTLTTESGATTVTRTTTLTSTLRPACYWRFFERLGTETEHDYILQSLKASLQAQGTTP